MSKSKKSACCERTYGLSGNDFRVTTFSKSYLIVKKNYYAEFEIDKTILTVPDGWTDPNYRKASILKIQ